MFWFIRLLQNIYFNINIKQLESIYIKSPQSYKSQLKCFKINKNKILLSTIHTGLIINIKIKQVETFIKELKNIYCMEKVGKYRLVGLNKAIS